jgi:uncharacterized protein involved in exopolysaccharide biosynthesis
MLKMQSTDIAPSSLLPKYSDRPAPVGLVHHPIGSQQVDVRPSTWKSASTLQHSASIIAGTAIAVTAGAIAPTLTQTPSYEGTFQLALQPVVATDGQPSFSFTQHHRSNLSSPEQDLETQIRVFQSHKLLDPVVQQLHKQGIDLTVQTLSDDLEIAADEQGTVSIHYRHAEPEVVQQVLKTLSQDYLDYTQACRTSACRGVEFIDAKLPQMQQQINALQQDLQQLQQRHGISNLDSQVQAFSNRSTKLAMEKAELQQNLIELRRQYTTLQTQLDLSSNEAIAKQILRQDLPYQQLLNRFKATEQHVAVELSRLDMQRDRMSQLDAQEHGLLKQLNQEAQQVLLRYQRQFISDERPVPPELQQLMSLAHYIQILEIRQDTIEHTEALFKQHRTKLAAVLRQHDTLQQQLQTAIAIQTEYRQTRERLQTQVDQQQPAAWQLITPPELVADHAGNPTPVYPNLPRDLGVGVALGMVFGVGIVVGGKKQSTGLTHCHPKASPMVATLELYPASPTVG